MAGWALLACIALLSVVPTLLTSMTAQRILDGVGMTSTQALAPPVHVAPIGAACATVYFLLLMRSHYSS